MTPLPPYGNGNRKIPELLPSMIDTDEIKRQTLKALLFVNAWSFFKRLLLICTKYVCGVVSTSFFFTRSLIFGRIFYLNEVFFIVVGEVVGIFKGSL